MTQSDQRKKILQAALLPIAQNMLEVESIIANEVKSAVSQVVAYYAAPQVPVYTPETLGAASPYENIHLLEERPEEERCLAVLTDPDTEPDDSLFPGYRGTKLGTYFAAYDTFDLWLLELP